MNPDPRAPVPTGPAENLAARRVRALKSPLIFGLTLLLGVVGGWFVHKLVDLERVPWQTLVQTLIAVVVLLVAATLTARVIFKAVIARSLAAVNAGMRKAVETIRQSPAALSRPDFWLDEVWPTLRETKSVAMAWLGVYSTMAAVVALTALLCQTGALAVAYLQIDRLDKQNEKLERQTMLMENQTELATAQNTLLASQNTLLEQQNLLSESARRAALLQIVGDVLASIDASLTNTSPEAVTGVRRTLAMPGAEAQQFVRADERTYQQASPRLIGRLAAACSSLRGYRYLGDDGKPIQEPRSPERGFVLRSLVAAGIDIGGLIDQRADFSYAEAENAVLDFFRLEPPPLAASTVPGSRGLILSYAQMEGVSFRGSRLGEANFKGAYLDNANFVGARLCNTSFEHAAIRGTKFTDADLRDAWLTGADATAADFSSAGVLGDTLLPLPQAFRMTEMSQVDLAGAYVGQEDWLELMEREARPGTFAKADWKIVPADRTPRCYHHQDEIRAEDLKSWRWRIANADGSLESSGTHGGTVITPRYDLHTPPPSPPKRR